MAKDKLDTRQNCGEVQVCWVTMLSYHCQQ